MKVVIMGAGGFGREVLDIIFACNQRGAGFEMEGWIIDPEYGKPGEIINGKPVLGGMDWLAGKAGKVLGVLAVGLPHVRRKFVKIAQDEYGIEFTNVIHPTAEISPSASIGVGVVMASHCILTPQAQVKSFTQLNMHSIVAHDSIMGDYSTLAMGVHVPGNICVEEGCYLGSGVSMVPPLKIGRWSVVGAGSVLLKDVPPNSVVVGNPGKVVKKRDEGWQEVV